MRTNHLLALICIFLSGCSRTIDFSLPNDEVIELSTISNGNIAKKCILPLGSETATQINTWFRNNAAGWEATPATYIPGVLVSGKTFSVNFLNESAIINYSGGQYAHHVSPKEYAFLSCP